jgi:hypothetical protein
MPQVHHKDNTNLYYVHLLRIFNYLFTRQAKKPSIVQTMVYNEIEPSMRGRLNQQAARIGQG